MGNISKPNISVSKLSVPSEQENTAHKVLVVAGKTSAGSGTSGRLYERIADKASANALFGARSQAADMIREMLKLNTKTRIDAIGISDDGDVAATATVTFAGAETATGTINITINGVDAYDIIVAEGWDAYAAAAELVALITADGGALVTASRQGAVVTLTVKEAGAAGNSLTLTKDVGTVTGLTCTLSGATFSGGSDAGVAATGSVLFSGTITAAGAVYVAIGSKVNRLYEIPVTVDMTAVQFATALKAKIDADTEAPFTAAIDSATVTLTMANAGSEGNRTLIKVYDDGLQAGMSWTLTAFSGGAGTPTMTSVLDAVGDTRYQTIVAPFGLGTTYLVNFLDARWNVNNKVQDGVAIVCKSDSYANLVSLGGTLNSKSLVVFGDKLLTDDDHKGPACPEFDYVKAAQFAAIRALRLTADADISGLVTSSVGSLDNYGGPAIASLPYFNTPMSLLPVLEDEFPGLSASEIDALRDLGISAMANNVSETAVICGEVVTTYKYDASSAVDTTWKYLETVDTASNVGEYFFNNLKADYSQCRLTTGDLVPGRAMANEESIRAGMMGYYQNLSGADYVLVQAGEAALNYFKANMTLAIDMSLGKVTATMKVPLVTQVRTIIVPLRMVLASVA